jgi:hypothetical protein
MEVMHPADIPVDDLACELDLVLETVKGLFIGGDLRPEEFDGQS